MQVLLSLPRPDRPDPGFVEDPRHVRGGPAGASQQARQFRIVLATPAYWAAETQSCLAYSVAA